MMNTATENKYKVGEVVYQKTNPKVKLVVRRYLNRIYYCTFQGEPEKKELALYERELMADTHTVNPDY